VKATSGTSSAEAARRSIPSADANAHLIFSSILAQKYFVSSVSNEAGRKLPAFQNINPKSKPKKTIQPPRMD
jgi:hypothetical protein